MTIITVEVDTYEEDGDDEELYVIKSQRLNIDIGDDDTAAIDGEYVRSSLKAKKIIALLEKVFSQPGHLGMSANVDIVAVDGEEAFYCPL